MISIIPRPAQIDLQTGTFDLNTKTVVVSDNEALPEAQQLVDFLFYATEIRPQINPELIPNENFIKLKLDGSLMDLGTEGYILISSPKRVTIRAAQLNGLFYGTQSLLQLLPLENNEGRSIGENSIPIPCVTMRDLPRFGWRGAMLDVSRHFMPPEFVKKFIQLLAMHKMNVFHIHLTDDQGWRIEIKKYPKLTEIGAWRKETLIGHVYEEAHEYDGVPHGGFYSQETIGDIVAFAAQHHVTIVPEIDMPGHTQAAIAAYPFLGNLPEGISVSPTWGIHKNILNANEETIGFMQDVLNEVLNLFPGGYIHIGGDEVEYDQWVQSQSIQARMRELNIKEEKGLYSYFIETLSKFLMGRGRRMVGWDEILSTNAKGDPVIMAWRGVDYGVTAVKLGKDVVMAPMEWTYLDWYQSEDTDTEPLAIGGYLPLEKAYSFEPIPDSLSADEQMHILGGQAQLWTEYMPNERHVEYMAFPRLPALAEALWTPKSERSFDDFKPRLQNHLLRLRELDVNFHDSR